MKITYLPKDSPIPDNPKGVMVFVKNNDELAEDKIGLHLDREGENYVHVRRNDADELIDALKKRDSDYEILIFGYDEAI